MEIREARPLLRPEAPHAWLPEGVRVLPDGRLLWITIQCGPDDPNGALHLLDPATGENRTTTLTGRPGFALPTEDPRTFLLGVERTVGWFHLESRRYEVLAEGLDPHCEGTILNDGEPCADGVFFGLKDTALESKKAGLYFLRFRDGCLLQLRDDQVCSNGKVVRELGDGRFELFDIDSPTRVVRRYEVDVRDEEIDDPRIAIDLRSERGVPDGMCAVPGTEEVIVAMFDPDHAEFGRALRCSLRDGSVLAEYRTPGATQVTCPAWLPGDGADPDRVVLTTATENLDPERLDRQPNAGCLFVVDRA